MEWLERMDTFYFVLSTVAWFGFVMFLVAVFGGAIDE